MPKKKNKKIGNGDGPTSQDGDPGSGNENVDRKYLPRQISSNWERYRCENADDDGVDEKKENDFADLINAPSDCNYFQFKSEKNWGNEANYSTFSGHKFFDLDLEVLSNGLACLPFYERVGINKSMLLQSDIERCDKKASEALPKYEKIKEKFMKKLQRDYELPAPVEDIRCIVSKSVKETFDLIHSKIIDIPSEVETVTGCLQDAEKLVDDKTVTEVCAKETKTEEEDLEKWLDSILDDTL